jgi:hypothetical protein
MKSFSTFGDPHLTKFYPRRTTPRGSHVKTPGFSWNLA